MVNLISTSSTRKDDFWINGGVEIVRRKIPTTVNTE